MTPRPFYRPNTHQTASRCVGVVSFIKKAVRAAAIKAGGTVYRRHTLLGSE